MLAWKPSPALSKTTTRKKTDTRDLRRASSVISRGLQEPPVTSHEVFDCLLKTSTSMSFHNHCQGGQCAHHGRGAGGEHIKYWSCTELALCSPPSSRQGGGRRGIIAAQAYFISCIMSHRIVSNRIKKSYRYTLRTCVSEHRKSMNQKEILGTLQYLHRDLQGRFQLGILPLMRKELIRKFVW